MQRQPHNLTFTGLKVISMQRPAPGTYNPHFQGYFDLVPEGDLLDLLQRNEGEAVELFLSIPEEKASYAYASGKWTIKEMLNHLIDAERIFAYRSLVAGRMDHRTDLMSFDENEYAAHVDVSGRSLQDLIEEFRIVRRASLFLFSNLTEQQASFMAKNGSYSFTANAGICFLIGHVIHHMNVLKERYL